ncbi:MAG TPA: copper chaperone PCu(A)C [Methylocystis sp.]|nr:copper chaperone PCu(A)C [Methylocystis sp.]
MQITRRDLLTIGGAAAGAALFGAGATAHEYEVGKLVVEHPWLRAPVEGESKAYLYGFFHNLGAADDRLVGVKSEKFGSIELHPDSRGDKPTTGIKIPAGQTTTLAPGGAYVLLLDIKKHLEVGWGLELTLTFEKAGEVVIDAAIEAPDAAHAHDAEAQARWEKAQNKDSAGPTSASVHEDNHDHHGHDHQHGDATDRK